MGYGNIFRDDLRSKIRGKMIYFFIVSTTTFISDEELIKFGNFRKRLLSPSKPIEIYPVNVYDGLRGVVQCVMGNVL